MILDFLTNVNRNLYRIEKTARLLPPLWIQKPDCPEKSGFFYDFLSF